MISLEQFDAIFPLACEWAAQQEQRILAIGVPLTDTQMSDARRVGVRQAERVRLLAVDAVMPPDHTMLNALANTTGLISPGTIGLTLQHGIYIRADQWGNRRLVAHELVHVMQYERMGGISAFLRDYLTECLYPPGYPHGPLEKEADRLSRAIC